MCDVILTDLLYFVFCILFYYLYVIYLLYVLSFFVFLFFFFKHKTAYEMRISYWSSDVCSSDLCLLLRKQAHIARINEKKLPKPKEVLTYVTAQLRLTMRASRYFFRRIIRLARKPF